MLEMTGRVAMRRRPAAASRGVSLVELIVVLAILMILFGIGVPSLRTFIEENRLAAATEDLFVAVQAARSEALARGMRVDLVPAANGDWTEGWMVFVDTNGNRRAERGESIVLRHAALGKGIRVDADFTDGRRPYLAYGAAGRTVTDAGPAVPQAGSFTLVLGDMRRKIKVNFAGRPRVCNPRKEAASC